MSLKRQTNISDLQWFLVFCEYSMAFNISFLAFSALLYGIFYLQIRIMEISKQIMNRVNKKNKSYFLVIVIYNDKYNSSSRFLLYS